MVPPVSSTAEAAELGANQGIQNGGTDYPPMQLENSASPDPVSAPACRAGALPTELIARLNAFLAAVVIGESITAYHSDKSRISCSSVKDFLRGPDYFYARHVEQSLPAPESSALSHGQLLHTWFENNDDSLSFVACPPTDTLTATGSIGQKAKKWAAENCPDALLVSPKEREQLEREVSKLLSNRAFCEWREQIVIREASVRFETLEGDRLRCRMDAATEDTWLDLKTTKEQDICRGFWKSVRDFGYDIQDAFYQMGMEACGLEPKPLVFIVVSTVPPHQTQCLTLPQDIVASARDRLTAALADLRLRTELDWWLPDSTNETVELFYPDFARR